MLKIVINILNTDKEIVKVPWDKYFKIEKITKYLDDTDKKIVESIEKTSLINNETIHGKFSDMPIGIGNLSEGCKTLLCINHAIKTNTIDKYLFFHKRISYALAIPEETGGHETSKVIRYILIFRIMVSR